MQFEYKTKGTCSQHILFEVEANKVKSVQFIGGCNGNLKAISKLVEGKSAEEISDVLAGNTCGMKNTSCADQLSKALRVAADKEGIE